MICCREWYEIQDGEGVNNAEECVLRGETSFGVSGRIEKRDTADNAGDYHVDEYAVKNRVRVVCVTIAVLI